MKQSVDVFFYQVSTMSHRPSPTNRWNHSQASWLIGSPTDPSVFKEDLKSISIFYQTFVKVFIKVCHKSNWVSLKCFALIKIKIYFLNLHHFNGQLACSKKYHKRKIMSNLWRNLPINGSMDRRINGSTDKQINRSWDQHINGSTDQRVMRSTDQQIKGSTDQRIIGS